MVVPAAVMFQTQVAFVCRQHAVAPAGHIVVAHVYGLFVLPTPLAAQS
jgi:hypothetical protein